jgi:hypothetical protein
VRGAPRRYGSSVLGTPWNRMLSLEPWVLLRWNRIPTLWNPMLMLISMILTRRNWRIVGISDKCRISSLFESVK